MKTHLMFRDLDFDIQRKLPWNEPSLTQDLGLSTLFKAMAQGDGILLAVVRSALVSGTDNSIDTIRYRQEILRDCLKNSALIKDIYAIAVSAIQGEKKSYRHIFRYPGAVLSESIEVMRLFVTLLKKLRQVADTHAGEFESEGFTTLFAMLQQELDDVYFATIEHHLDALAFGAGILISADLGKGCKGANYMLRKMPERQPGWVQRIFASKPEEYSWRVPARDEAGAKALSELKDRGIDQAGRAIARSTDHILGFFTLLRTELAFYIGCLNLYQQLTKNRDAMCFPVPIAPEERSLSFKGLCDVYLNLNLGHKVVSNDVNADNKDILIITGANQGGKSTFLRSLGLAQLMMQAGMFVAAESFCSTLCTKLFTHYKREEDSTMQSGKLDEELSRMSDIVDHMTENSILLLNESFAATNEREGSQIARQIVGALSEMHVKVIYVTHLYEYTHDLYQKNMKRTIFLRAERRPDGERTFRLMEGEPLQTSHGEDLYDDIFDGYTRSTT